MSKQLKNYALAGLRSTGQIMLIGNAAIGLVFLIILAIWAPKLFLGALLGIAVSSVTANALKVDSKKFNLGLFGYNAALVGMAIVFVYGLNTSSLLLTVFGSILSTHGVNLFFKWRPNIPVFTAPFVLTTWLLFALAPYLALTPLAQNSSVSANPFHYFDGVSQVMFIQSSAVSLMLALAIAFHAIKTAIWVILASLFGAFFANSFGFSDQLIQMGLYGYNAVLVAIVLSGKKQANHYLICLGICISVILTKGFHLADFPPLTAPFILTCWLMHAFDHQASRKRTLSSS